LHVARCVPEPCQILSPEDVGDAPDWLPWDAHQDVAPADALNLPQHLFRPIHMFEYLTSDDDVERRILERQCVGRGDAEVPPRIATAGGLYLARTEVYARICHAVIEQPGGQIAWPAPYLQHTPRRGQSQ